MVDGDIWRDRDREFALSRLGIVGKWALSTYDNQDDVTEG